MGGSRRASGPELQQPEALALSKAHAATVWPEPGPSAGTASGGRLAGSEGVWGEPEGEEEEGAGSAHVGMMSSAAELPQKEAAEAGW